MVRKRIAWLGEVALVLAGAVLMAAPARAETVVEAWRSPFGYTTSVARTAPDGTVWVASGASVLHLTATGSLLSQTNGLAHPRSCAVAPDGSCWVVLTSEGGDAVHLAEDGSELGRISGFGYPWEIAVSGDGATIWVVDQGVSQVVHMTAAGVELWRAAFEYPGAIAADPNDDSCWVADRNFWYNFAQLVRLDAGGAKAWESPIIPGWSALDDIALDPSDGSAWICLGYPSELRHYSAAGDLLTTLSGGVTQPGSLGLSAFDGALWVGDETYGEVAKVGADGSLLYHGTDFTQPYSPAPDPTDGSCWFVELMGVMHLAGDGSEILHLGGQGAPYSVSVSPADNSVWAGLGLGQLGDFLSGGVLHIAENGAQLWFSDTVLAPMSVSANAADGTAWAVDTLANQVVHLGTDGAELWRGGTFQSPLAVAANPNDGSVWASDSLWLDSTAYGNVVHLSGSGEELARNSDFREPRRLSVNTADNSVWVADRGQLEIVMPQGFVWQYAKLSHLDANGSPIWEMPYDPEMIDSYQACSVNSADGSVWATNWDLYWDKHEVLHLAANGSPLWSTTSFSGPGEIVVNPTDGTIWLTDNVTGIPIGGGHVVHLSADGSTELWRGTGFASVESLAVNAADGSCWVADTGNGQLVHLVIAAPPAADFTAAPVSGLAPLTVAFTDLSTGAPSSWAWAFGDGATSVEQNPGYTYASAGSYTVALTVANALGSDTEAKTGYITVYAVQDATRNAGYWATHPAALVTAFTVLTGSASGEYLLCGEAISANDAMAIFWEAQGQRGQLASQVIAAICNNTLFHPAPGTLIADATGVLCDATASEAQIGAMLDGLGAYNDSGSALPVQTFDFDGADITTAKAMADAGTVPDFAAGP